jgi:hypothetical protein
VSRWAAAERGTFSAARIAFGVFLVAVVAVIFVPYAASYFFIFDDYAQLDFVASHTVGEILVTPEHGNFRPVAFLFWNLWLESFGIGRPWAFSLFNLSAHALNAVLLGWVLLRFRSRAVMAWSAAAVFLVFPPINEALFWMSGGHDVYGMTFLLLAVLAASLGLTASPGIRSLLPMAALAFAGTLAAMLAKETAYVACPLVASLAWRSQAGHGRLPWRVWLTWIVALNAAVAVFFLLRGLVIPIGQSAYGDPRELYARSELLGNVVDNLRALFTFGYSGVSPWIARACRLGGWLAGALAIAGVLDRSRRLGTVFLATTLGLALAATAFVGIGAGAAASGRLLYMSAMIASIMVGAGLAGVLVPDGHRHPLARPLQAGGLGLLAMVVGLEAISLHSFSLRFREATSIARNVMAQVAPLRDTAFVHVRNLPHALAGGPFGLKCYALPVYLRLTGGPSPAFRCDQVVLRYDGRRYREITPREPDVFSSYHEARSDERELELVFLSYRNCPSHDVPACVAQQAARSPAIHVLHRGDSDPSDVLRASSGGEADRLVRGGSWKTAGCMPEPGAVTRPTPREEAPALSGGSAG